MYKAYKLLVKHASELVPVTRNGEFFLHGKKMNNLELIRDGCLCVGWDGRLTHVGTTKEVLDVVDETSVDTVLNLRGEKSIVPGLVDSHTHPVWSGDRCFEFSLKLGGATYMDIHSHGGGIGYTVKKVEETTEEVLVSLMKERLNRMMHFGTTLVEAKSGYGLNWKNELKMLKVIELVKKSHVLDVVSTYLGAHSIPKDKTANQATQDIVENQIPKLKSLCQSGFLSVEFIDIFHEKKVFETENALNIMKTALEHGFDLNIHGDELHANGSAELGSKLGAKAISHLECITEEGQRRMFECGTVAVLLPTTAHLLKIKQPPGRKMIDNNIIVAIATDFNPNAFCLSMPFTMNLACITLNMTMNEALVASTINAAASINRSSSHGSLEPFKHADFVIIDDFNWQHLIYEMASTPIHSVYKDGFCVHRKLSNVLK